MSSQSQFFRFRYLCLEGAIQNLAFYCSIPAINIVAQVATSAVELTRWIDGNMAFRYPYDPGQASFINLKPAHDACALRDMFLPGPILSQVLKMSEHQMLETPDY